MVDEITTEEKGNLPTFSCSLAIVYLVLANTLSKHTGTTVSEYMLSEGFGYNEIAVLLLFSGSYPTAV